MKRFKVIVGSIILSLAFMLLFAGDAYAQVYKADNVSEFRKIIYKDMLQRKNLIEVDYSGDDYKEIFETFEKQEFINELSKIDDKSTSDDHDYMIQNVSYMKTSMRGVNSNKVHFTIYIHWRETLGKLQYVNLRVEDILQKSLIKESFSQNDLEVPIFYFLKNICGVETYMDLTRLHPATATAKIAEILEIPVGTPLLNMEETDYDIYGKILFYSRQYFVDDYFDQTVLRKKL